MNLCPEHTAAVVVWFHPTPRQAETLRAYASVLSRVYIVDNSEEDNTLLAQTVDQAVYLPNRTNKGIASALNRGYEKAIEDGTQWIISFDQDSRLSAAQLTEFLHLCAQCDIPDVGLFAPYPYYGNDRPNEQLIYEQRDWAFTSGALMSADTYRLVGRFRDELFIDLVDEEYCLRLRRLGKAIVIVHRIVMEHSLGEGMITTPVLHHRFVEHNAIRHYYIVRNTLVLMHDYPEARTHYRRQLIKRLKRLCLYDWHHKGQKWKMCCIAWYDYRHHHMNQYHSSC